MFFFYQTVNRLTFEHTIFWRWPTRPSFPSPWQRTIRDDSALVKSRSRKMHCSSLSNIILSYPKYICMFSSIYRYGFIDIKNLTIVLQWKSHSLICFIDQSNYQMRIQEILSSTPPSSSIISFPGPNTPQVNYIKDLVSNQWGPIIECRGDDGGCSEGCGRRRSWHRYIL